jgi:hypothetical protein
MPGVSEILEPLRWFEPAPVAVLERLFG